MEGFPPGPWTPHVGFDGDPLSIKDRTGQVIMAPTANEAIGMSPVVLAAVLALPELVAACEAAIAYDAAIQRHAAKGQGWVEGEDLDTLYERWIDAAKAAKKKLGQPDQV